MNFYIGGISSNDIDSIESFPEAKIYGVILNQYNLYDRGTRLYTSKRYQFSPSTSTSPGRDDFITNEAGPFMIRECATRYNSSTGKQEVAAYKGDSNWASVKNNTSYHKMIEFPKFYYYMPNYYTIAVSSELVKGFKPSPMHYRNGHMYDYVYISKYPVNSDIMSTGSDLYTCDHSTLFGNKTIVTNLLKKELRMLDYKVFYSLMMLMVVKYNTFDFHSIFGGLYGSNNYKTDYTLSGDGSQITYSNIYYNTISTMGLINFYHNRGCWINGIGTGTEGSYLYRLLIDSAIDSKYYPLDLQKMIGFSKRLNSIQSRYLFYDKIIEAFPIDCDTEDANARITMTITDSYPLYEYIPRLRYRTIDNYSLYTSYYRKTSPLYSSETVTFIPMSSSATTNDYSYNRYGPLQISLAHTDARYIRTYFCADEVN